MRKNYIGAGLIAIAMVLFWSLVLPFYSGISDLDAAIKEREDLLNSRNTIMTNIKNLSIEYQKEFPKLPSYRPLSHQRKASPKFYRPLIVCPLKTGSNFSVPP